MLFALTQERDQLQAIARRCPSDRAREIDALTTQRHQIADRLAAAQKEIMQLDQERRWCHRGNRSARRVVLANQADDLTDRIRRSDRELERARDAHGRHRDNIAEHRDELDRLPGVQHAIEARLAQLVNADVANRPRYLRDLGVPPDDLARLTEWCSAAAFVERYRIDNCITDPRLSLGAEPKGAAGTLRRYDSRHLENAHYAGAASDARSRPRR